MTTEQVFKRLNALATGTRELVLDLNARKMYNIDDEKVASGKKVGHGKNTQQIAELELGRGTLHDHEVRKVTFSPSPSTAGAGADDIDAMLGS